MATVPALGPILLKNVCLPCAHGVILVAPQVSDFRLVQVSAGRHCGRALEPGRLAAAAAEAAAAHNGECALCFGA
eukprot:762975-Hanusia_phi.AAC.1